MQKKDAFYGVRRMHLCLQFSWLLSCLPRGFRGPKLVEALYAKIGVRDTVGYRQL